MNPPRFLFIGGTILVVIGYLGLVGVLGAISSAGFFHPPSWINWVHFFFGIFVLYVASSRNDRLQTRLTLFGAMALLTIGILGMMLGSFMATRYNVPELADPSDHIVHFLIGMLALWGWWNRKKNVPSPGENH